MTALTKKFQNVAKTVKISPKNTAKIENMAEFQQQKKINRE